MVEHGPWATVTELNGGEENGVEVDVVLAHELEQPDVLVVEPPLLPLRGVVGGDAGVSDRCVELVKIISIYAV